MIDLHWNVVDFDAQLSTKDLSEESASFIWLNLLKDVLIQIPQYEHRITNEQDEIVAKREMIHHLRQFHADNPQQLAKIDEFEKNYDRKEMAVYSYSKDACIHQPINIALRTADIDALLKYRYFISHLSSDLADKCASYHRDQTSAKKFRVYRGQILSTKEIDQLRQNVHRVVAINGFFSTSRNRNVAQQFAGNAFFEIEIDLEKHPELIFGDIANVSQFTEEQEVLFDISTVFRIEKVDEEIDGLVCIHLTANNEGRTLLERYLSLQRAEMPEFSLVMMFGRLLCLMGRYEKAKKHFTHLLENTQEDKASLYHNLGLVEASQQNFYAALEKYNVAQLLLQEAVPVRRQELATTLNNMAVVFSQLGDHQQALQYFQHSLTILKEFRPDDHVDIASAYNNIGSVYRELGESELAHANHRLALGIYGRLGLPDAHPYTADCVHNLALVLHDREDFTGAKILYEKALALRRICQLPNHPDIATNLNDIGYVLCDDEQVEEGFKYFEEAYTLRTANPSTSRIDLADSFNNMGVVNRHRGNLSTAIDFYERSMALYQAALPSDHPVIAKVQNNLLLAQALNLSMTNADV